MIAERQAAEQAAKDAVPNTGQGKGGAAQVDSGQGDPEIQAMNAVDGE